MKSALWKSYKNLSRGFFVILSIILSNALSSGEFTFGTGHPHSLSELKKNKLSINRIGPSENRLELAKVRFKNSELLLDFENKKPDDLKDKNNNYEVREAVYSPIEGKSPFGKRYASFTTKESQIRVYSGDGKVLSENIISVPLYFSFYIMPGDLEQSSNVFSKSYLTGGKKYGIECKIINNKIEVSFHNFFSFNQYETKTYVLQSPDKINTKTWTHVLITLEPTLGLGKLYENGEEKTSFKAIRSNTDTTPLLSGFHPNDTTPLVIGKDFYGKLDNFIIGKGDLPDVTRMNIPYQDVVYDGDFKQANHQRGSAHSKVLRTKNSHSLPSQIDYKSIEPPGTHLEIHYRFSEEPFEEDDNLPVWKNFDPKTFHIKEKDTYFSYFQWKVVMRSNYNGMETPGLRYFSLKYKDSLPPNPPSGLRVVGIDHEKKEVCFQWNSNHETDVIDGGGYILHYGVTPNRMVGTILYGIDGKQITGIPKAVMDTNETQKNKVKKSYLNLEACLNNEIITFNSEYLKDKNLLFFKPGITYYFKLTAYNHKFPLGKPIETVGYDQKSEPSKPTLATFHLETGER